MRSENHPVRFKTNPVGSESEPVGPENNPSGAARDPYRSETELYHDPYGSWHDPYGLMERSRKFFGAALLFFKLHRANIVFALCMNRLNSGFSKLADDQFDNKAQSIVAALTGNANFPTTTPTLASIGTDLTACQQALAMQSGQARDTQIAATRAKLADSLEKLARGLELVPNVTEAMLATSGFELRKVPSVSGEIVAAPGNVRLKQTGVSGVVQVLCDAVNRASAYEMQYTLDPNAGPWIDGETFASTRGIGISGLTRGKDYWVRLRAIGTNGPGPWSDPATILVS
jgi:hypothetical protein